MRTYTPAATPRSTLLGSWSNPLDFYHHSPLCPQILDPDSSATLQMAPTSHGLHESIAQGTWMWQKPFPYFCPYSPAQPPLPHHTHHRPPSFSLSSAQNPSASLSPGEWTRLHPDAFSFCIRPPLHCSSHVSKAQLLVTPSLFTNWTPCCQCSPHPPLPTPHPAMLLPHSLYLEHSRRSV